MKLLPLSRLRSAGDSASERYLSPALKGHVTQSFSTSPLAGVEARIHNRIWAAIIDRRLRPGTRLKEETICEAFGVSRTIVRKVLLILEQEGALALPANRGAFVATPVPEEAVAIIELARLLTSHTVARLVSGFGKLSPDSWKLIDRHLEAEDAALARQDHRSLHRLVTEFPLLLSMLAGNRYIRTVQERVETLLAMVLALYQERPPEMPPPERHRCIADLIAKGEMVQAVQGVNDYYEALLQGLRIAPLSGEEDLHAILTDETGAPPSGEVRKKKVFPQVMKKKNLPK